jgi:hypothetical protein
VCWRGKGREVILDNPLVHGTVGTTEDKEYPTHADTTQTTIKHKISCKLVSVFLFVEGATLDEMQLCIDFSVCRHVDV